MPSAVTLGTWLDGRKEAECFGITSKDKGKAGVNVNRCQSRKASLKYMVC